MTIELDGLSYDGLLEPNDCIIARLKRLEATDALNAMIKFNLGARVCFDSSKHGMQVGTLIKFNRKTVTVLTDEGRRWMVSPQMLSLVVGEATDGTNVIDLKQMAIDPS